MQKKNIYINHFKKFSGNILYNFVKITCKLFNFFRINMLKYKYVSLYFKI